MLRLEKKRSDQTKVLSVQDIAEQRLKEFLHDNQRDLPALTEALLSMLTRDNPFDQDFNPPDPRLKKLFEKDKREGVTPRGNPYIGEWINGVPHGEGRGLKEDVQETYAGEWLKGMIRGYGVYTFPSGEEFRGVMDAGVKQGLGRAVLSSGKTYYSHYKRSVKEGPCLTSSEYFPYRFELQKNRCTTGVSMGVNDLFDEFKIQEEPDRLTRKSEIRKFERDYRNRSMN